MGELYAHLVDQEGYSEAEAAEAVDLAIQDHTAWRVKARRMAKKRMREKPIDQELYRLAQNLEDMALLLSNIPERGAERDTVLEVIKYDMKGMAMKFGEMIDELDKEMGNGRWG